MGAAVSCDGNPFQVGRISYCLTSVSLGDTIVIFTVSGKLASLRDAVATVNVPTGPEMPAEIIADVKADTTPTVTPRNTVSKNGQASGRTDTAQRPMPAAPSGFAVADTMGMPDPKSMKPTTVKATTNEWWPIVEWLALDNKVRVLTFTGEKGVKSPLSRFKSAIQRAQNLNIKNAYRLRARSGAEKGTWKLYLNV